MVLLQEVMTRGHSKVKDEPNDTFENVKETENKLGLGCAKLRRS